MTKPNGTTLGLLIGAGSVGRRHAAVMAQRYQQLAVIDVNDDALAWARSQFSNVTMTAKSLDELAGLIGERADQTTALIATWGPSHYEVFVRLVDLGVRQIFCEKPVAVSLQQLSHMRKLCADHEIRFTAGLHLRYRGIAEFVHGSSQEHLGGLPTMFVVDGGARCIATTGSHWLDLAMAVFGSNPIGVVAVLRDHPINPRSNQLRYWEGSATWEFSEGQRITISYDNASSVHERARFYARNGVIEIDPELTCRVFARDLAEIHADSRVIRVGDVDVSTPLETFTPILESVLSVQLDEIEGRKPQSYASSTAFDSATALVAAFEASRLGRRLTLPIEESVIAAGVEWNIS